MTHHRIPRLVHKKSNMKRRDQKDESTGIKGWSRSVHIVVTWHSVWWEAAISDHFEGLNSILSPLPPKWVDDSMILWNDIGSITGMLIGSYSSDKHGLMSHFLKERKKKLLGYKTFHFIKWMDLRGESRFFSLLSSKGEHWHCETVHWFADIHHLVLNIEGSLLVTR